MPVDLLPGARGNGLEANAWTAIADVEPARAEVLLRSLAASRVPACTTPIRDAPRLVRVFVDPALYRRADNVLLSELCGPSPARYAAPQGAAGRGRDGRMRGLRKFIARRGSSRQR
jgi:hypothetical protein